MKQDSIPFYKSPFLKDDIHSILKYLLEDNNFNTSYYDRLVEEFKRIKNSTQSILFSSFALAFSTGIEYLGLKVGDTILVSELLSEELMEVLRSKQITVLPLPIHHETLSLEYEKCSIATEQHNIKAIYLDFPIAYNGSLEQFMSLDIPLLLNDSAFWGIEDLLHQDIVKLPQKYKDKLIVCSSFKEGDFLHLGGEGGALHLYSAYNNIQVSLCSLYAPCPLSCYIGLLQFQKMEVYLENRKQIWVEYTNTLKVKSLNYISSFKSFTLRNKDIISLKNYFNSKNIETKTLKELYKSILPVVDSSFEYLSEQILFLPLYPTLSKNDIKMITHIINQSI